MGRPINKKFLTNFGVLANISGTVNAYQIKKQESSNEFLIGAYPGATAPYHKVKMVPKVEGSLLPGEMNLRLVTHTGSYLYAAKISGHKVTANDGHEYKWFSTNSSSTPGSIPDGTVWITSWELYC
jgi:hypothetical protein